MIQITKDYIPVNKYSRAGLKLKAKRGIVMHYTASPGRPRRTLANTLQVWHSKIPIKQ